MTTVYRMLWKHKDFLEHSEGPVLKHSATKQPYTKRWAEKICHKFNENGKIYKTKNNKGKAAWLPVVQHWVREVLA